MSSDVLVFMYECRWFPPPEVSAGADCVVPPPNSPKFIREGGRINGTQQAPIVIKGANPVSTFLAAFRELASIPIPEEFAR